ncbi:sodium/hydrogen exchanger [Paenibacillus mucilaginosus 3016]|uniref:Sodium/hydrogen exchanger n=1 Tax=Paenibacillus mucilaginosus 3016 TaxID=1116391 RepID=H6NED9_9BACL|nr:sodium:proton antiporter [Paenibacillus mucilaginosus]AFC28082.1 sodium/hydrogen exchanger [Paenibacillus mucilaginosus 3016]WFA16930.1 sodium:proton antiporter [Paenibacillus mucilaginosus]
MEQGVSLEHVLYLLVIILLTGMLVGRLSGLLKLPDVALFLIAGIVLGPLLHWIHEPSSSFTNQFILTVGSTLILFDGGRNIRLAGLKKVWLTLTLLSIPGVLITCAIVAAASHWLLHLPWMYALLLGAIISSTDPATLIPVFKQVRVRTKVRETVESESAFNDATGSILTFTLLGALTGGGAISLGDSVKEFLITALGGIGAGVLIGLALAFLTVHRKFGFLRDYAGIVMLVTAAGAYLAGDLLHVSGFMATFTAGLIWGNAELFGLDFADRKQELHHVAENLTVLLRMLIFVLLGSQVDFGVIGEYLVPSLGVIAIFMLIARPMTVLLCALPDTRAKWERNELLFMFWVRETGVIPAALSGMVVGMGIAHADIIASVTFLAVLVTILLQAGTTAYAARRLGLEEKAEP